MSEAGDTAATTDRALVPSKPVVEATYDWGGPVEPAPLFLHSSFRSGSTWLWEKIRGAPTTLAYYEFFHEMLAHLTPAQVKAIVFDSWSSHHPETPPYFLEFLPLLRPEGGVAGFDGAMAFGGMVPQGGLDGDLADAERAYVDRLIAAARPSGRIPVLTCTRSLGRARALRRCVGGRAVLLHRNLFHQWASYCSQCEGGNTYFLDTIRLSVEASAHDPFLRALATWFDVRNPLLPREELFAVFVLLHLYLQGAAFDAADLVVDLTEIATDTSACRRVERDISEMIRHPLDLSDVRHVCELPDMGFVWSKTLRDTIEQFAKLIPETGHSADSVRFIEHTKDRALAEWERFEFFNRGTRTVLTRKIDGLESQLTEKATRERDLQSELERLRAEAAHAQAEAAHLRAEADPLWAEANQLRVEACHLRAGIDDLRAERDGLRQATNVVQAEKDGLIAVAADLRAEKEALVQRVAEAETDAHALDARVAALSSERDLAATNAQESAAQHAELEQALAAEREGSLPRRIWRLVAKPGRQGSDR